MQPQNKHVFRLYRVIGDSLYSPFQGMLYDSDKSFIGKMNTPHRATQESYETMTDTNTLLHKGIKHEHNPKHYGFSVIGKPDYKYSIFPIELMNIDERNDVVDAINKELESYIPEDAKQRNDLSAMYADDEKNDYDYLTNKLYSQKERLNGLMQCLTDTDSNHKIDNITIDPKWLNYDSDNTWDNFVDTLGQLKSEFDGEDDIRMILSSVPEDKLISVDDAINKGLSFQRDYPEELISSEVTPLKDINNFDNAISHYNTLRRKGAKGSDAFGDSFQLDPNTVVSDSVKKHIYKDLTSWYNNKNKQSSILKGIKEFGQ